MVEDERVSRKKMHDSLEVMLTQLVADLDDFTWGGKGMARVLAEWSRVGGWGDDSLRVNVTVHACRSSIAATLI